MRQSWPDLNQFKVYPDSLAAHAGYALLVTDLHGSMEQGPAGFYFRQTRFLSRAVLTVEGKPPKSVSANPVDSYSMLAYYAAESPAGPAASAGSEDPSGGEIAEKGLVIQLDRFVGGGMHQDVVVTNHGLARADFELAWDLGADYADVEEVIERDGERLQSAPVEREWSEEASHAVLRLGYQHPELAHGTELRFARHGSNPTYRDERVIYRLSLAPQQSVRLCMDLVPVFCGERILPEYGCQAFRSERTPLDRMRRQLLEDSARLRTPVTHVQAAWDRAVADLASLPLFEGPGDEAFTPAAGIPLFQEQYGRDALTTGWQASLMGPSLLKGSLLMVAGTLGTRDDPATDEAPGRVIQQAKRSPLALLGVNPFRRFYGDYAGPGMFLVSVAWYFAQTGDADFVRSLEPQIDAVLGWIDERADLDGDGFYEYETRQQDARGKNQGWMDSPDALRYEDGRLMPNPIAVVEVQGYYFAAKQLLGLMYLFLGKIARGTSLLAEAQDLKRRFNQAFWLPEEQTFAQALDAHKRPVRNIASNVGHCLACGIVDQDKAAAVAGRLMAPDMFSGWGIRTLSSRHVAFNPFAYHLGSVWPSENASIALGFKRYGLNPLLHDLARGLFEATLLFDHPRLPEALGGFQRDAAHPHPGIYPLSNSPQSWSSSAILLLVQAMAGLVPLAPLHTLLVDPDLPDWLPELTLENVQVGAARLSLHLKRDAGGYTDYRILERSGHLRVLRQPPPNSVDTGFGDRIASALWSLAPHG